ncbi:hypothetical protein [Streptosporangium sp. NPDC051022]|uniref:hypothetical protein n=1 Tax=Streptosporangium sp. NPDC051022 TaxID=3155752 RepID=UPI0034417702
MQDIPPVVSEEPAAKKSFWRSSKGGCLVVTLVPVIGLLLLVLLVMIPMWVNNGKLADMIGRFEDYPLPPETGWSDYGGEGSIVLRGNGNHCDYRARFTFETGLAIDELTAYYNRANIAGIEGSRAAITLWIQPSSEGAAYRSQTVIVELNSSTDAGMDIRCH